MSTKTGLKKTFSWRFGPSKFSRKNKTHSEVWTFICVFDAFLLLLLLYFYSKALHCSEQQKQTSFDPVIFTIQFVSTNKRGCCFSHILTRLVSVFGSFSQHLIIINSITHFFWVFLLFFSFPRWLLLLLLLSFLFPLRVICSQPWGCVWERNRPNLVVAHKKKKEKNHHLMVFCLGFISSLHGRHRWF